MAMRALTYIILSGYSIFGRTFAYLGLLPFYPAEVYILAACTTRARDMLNVLLGMLRHADVIFLSFVVFLLWGLIETLRAVSATGDLAIALKGLAPHYYVLLFFIGISVSAGESGRDFANKMGVLGIACGAYAIAAAFANVGLRLPWVSDRDVDLIEVGFGVNPCLVAVVALGPLLGRRMLLPLIFLGIAILGPVPRASLLGATVGIIAVLIDQRNLRMLFYFAIGTVILFLFSTLAGEAIVYGGGARSGTMTFSWVLARLVSSIDPDLAFSMLVKMGAYSEAFKVYSLHETGTWRLLFWTNVMNSLNTEWLWLVGHGYSISLGDIANVGHDIRTPHNFVLYFLGYTGVIGLMSFVFLLGALFAQFIALPRSPIRAFLIGELLALIVQAFFSNNFETPYVAVPFYLTTGIAYGVARRQVKVRVASLAGGDSRGLLYRRARLVSDLGSGS